MKETPDQITQVYETKREITLIYVIPVYTITRLVIADQDLRGYLLAPRRDDLFALLNYIRAKAPQATIGYEDDG